MRARVNARKTPAWRSPLAIVSAAAVIVIVLVIILLPKPGGSSDLAAPPTNTAAAAGLADGEALGKANAPARLEIWSDFQCPICGNLVRDYLPRFNTDLVIPGQVRIVPHDIAILGATAENESLAAAVGARCAGAQGHYWEFHDWLFYNQNGENLGAFAADRLKAIADKVGLDRSLWDACVADSAQAAAIRSNTSQATVLRINSTPSFRVNDGEIQVGLPRTYADFAALVRNVLPGASPSGIRTATPAPGTSGAATPAPTPAGSPGASPASSQ